MLQGSLDVQSLGSSPRSAVFGVPSTSNGLFLRPGHHLGLPGIKGRRLGNLLRSGVATPGGLDSGPHSCPEGQDMARVVRAHTPVLTSFGVGDV